MKSTLEDELKQIRRRKKSAANHHKDHTPMWIPILSGAVAILAAILFGLALYQAYN